MGEIESAIKAIRAEMQRARSVVPAEKAKAFKAFGVDAELGIIYGIGAAAGSPDKLDLDDEFVSKGDLVKMAFDFCSGARTFKANHKEELSADLVQSWVGAPIIDTEKGLRRLDERETLSPEMNVVGIDVTKGAETHWFVAVKPHDPEVVEIAKKGGVAGFSFGAAVRKVEV